MPETQHFRKVEPHETLFEGAFQVTSPTRLLVREIEMAYSLGFTEIEPFRRALKSGDVPAPNEYIAGKPVWYRHELEARYGTSTFEGSREGDANILQHIEAAL